MSHHLRVVDQVTLSDDYSLHNGDAERGTAPKARLNVPLQTKALSPGTTVKELEFQITALVTKSNISEVGSLRSVLVSAKVLDISIPIAALAHLYLDMCKKYASTKSNNNRMYNNSSSSPIYVDQESPIGLNYFAAERVAGSFSTLSSALAERLRNSSADNEWAETPTAIEKLMSTIAEYNVKLFGDLKLSLSPVEHRAAVHKVTYPSPLA
jgi:hypothetical protein